MVFRKKKKCFKFTFWYYPVDTQVKEESSAEIIAEDYWEAKDILESIIPHYIKLTRYQIEEV